MYLQTTITWDAPTDITVSGVQIYKMPNQKGIGYLYQTILASGTSGWTTSWTDNYGLIGDSYYVQWVTISGLKPYPPRNYQHGTTNGLDLMIEEVRRLIGDEKFSFTSIARETVGITSGSNYAETFYTSYMPVLPGSDALWVGRWFYTPVLASGDIYGMRDYLRGINVRPARQYVYSIDDASFFLASGVPRNSGDTVYANYTWLEPRAARFADTEIKLFLTDAIPLVENRLQVGLDSSGYGPELTIGGISDAIIARMLVLNASNVALQSLQQTLTADAIYVSDGGTTIDTTRSLRDRALSIGNLDKMIEDMMQIYQLRQQLSEVSRIDTYSTTTVDQNGIINLGQYIEYTSHDNMDQPPVGYE